MAGVPNDRNPLNRLLRGINSAGGRVVEAVRDAPARARAAADRMAADRARIRELARAAERQRRALATRVQVRIMGEPWTPDTSVFVSETTNPLFPDTVDDLVTHGDRLNLSRQRQMVREIREVRQSGGGRSSRSLFTDYAVDGRVVRSGEDRQSRLEAEYARLAPRYRSSTRSEALNPIDQGFMAPPSEPPTFPEATTAAQIADPAGQGVSPAPSIQRRIRGSRPPPGPPPSRSRDPESQGYQIPRPPGRPARDDQGS